MKIQKAKIEDAMVLAELACCLWPDHTAEEMQAEMLEMLQKPDAALFIACTEDATIGFAQCQLRRDYVEGTESSPVGYLEGIYVAEAWRHQGVAKSLLKACEAWARACGCMEFASDCELENEKSLQFHLHAGFEEANRIICFTKKL